MSAPRAAAFSAWSVTSSSTTPCTAAPAASTAGPLCDSGPAPGSSPPLLNGQVTLQPKLPIQREAAADRPGQDQGNGSDRSVVKHFRAFTGPQTVQTLKLLSDKVLEAAQVTSLGRQKQGNGSGQNGGKGSAEVSLNKPSLIRTGNVLDKWVWFSVPGSEFWFWIRLVSMFGLFLKNPEVLTRAELQTGETSGIGGGACLLPQAPPPFRAGQICLVDLLHAAAFLFLQKAGRSVQIQMTRCQKYIKNFFFFLKAKSSETKV